MDKTVATNTKSFYLRAKTRGYKYAEQQFEFVICPRSGANTITPPAAYSPTTIDATSGNTLNLATGSLYAMIDYGAGGSNANAQFNAWSISDVYEGCGRFLYYQVAPQSGTSGYIQYPEPGYSLTSHCQYNINNCRRVRMTSTTSIRIRSFTLYLYPEYNQYATGIPFVVDLTPCRSTYNFYRNSNPPDLVLTRQPSS
jgi:hypothetical protein